ncbi:hypothetical protein J1605_009191 [Eschrichtius robustus]|uniref:Uncharacterized protein n=1 Tax=Eschrichtius robustus TaxID=9764 RepID=A0AB34GXJ6_ESCRO|nr:hypothetical protein J1605_009191 [Eschrichtius robustus]
MGQGGSCLEQRRGETPESLVSWKPGEERSCGGLCLPQLCQHRGADELRSPDALTCVMGHPDCCRRRVHVHLPRVPGVELVPLDTPDPSCVRVLDPYDPLSMELWALRIFLFI